MRRTEALAYCCATLVALALLAGGAGAFPAAVTGHYLLTFHACDRATLGEQACRDTRNHRIYLTQSNDGASWSLVPGWKPYTGSVPDPIRRGDTIYIYSRDDLTLHSGVVSRYHLDTGVLDPPVAVQVTGLGTPGGFVDPSLILGSDGKLVLFFLPLVAGTNPAGCQPSENPCIKHFQSATEIAGSDGARFTLDSGDRLTMNLTEGGLSTASDPDIFGTGSGYVLYISSGPSTLAFTSTSLRGSYAQVSTLAQNTGGIASGYFDVQTQRYWTYAHVSRDGAQVIRRAVHPNLTSQLQESDWSTVLSGASIGLGAGFDVESPGFAVNTAGVVQCVVPKVKGKSLAAAKKAIVKGNCRVGKVGYAYSAKVRKGRVISQKPAAGKKLAKGAKVSLAVSRGKKKK
jgi:hypothetical protein